MVSITQALDILIKRQLKVLRFLGASSGSFKIPDDVNLFYVTAVAGGGSGTTDEVFSLYSSGGGSGEYVYRKIIGAIPGETLTYTVGKGGRSNWRAHFEPGIPGGITSISRNGNEIFKVLGGQGGQVVDGFGPATLFIGGLPGYQNNNPRYSNNGGYGRPYAATNFGRGRGGSNPLGSSKLFPTDERSPSSYGFGYGGGGCSTFGRFNFQGDGGNGALIIEYFTST